MSGPFRDLSQRMSNWGRWGDSDQLGTLNLITDALRIAAFATVREGQAFALALDLNSEGPQPADSSRQNIVHTMTRNGSSTPEAGGFLYFDDLVTLHTHASTQLDALSHVAYDGLLYNGHPVGGVTDAGAANLGIETLREGIIGRGVLLDLPRSRGEEVLQADHVITPGDIEDCLLAQRTTVGAGDCVLIRTGWITHFIHRRDRSTYLSKEPGIGLEAAAWFRDRDVAFLASDNWAVEVVPAEHQVETMPVHCLLVRDAGMPLGEMFDLEHLAVACGEGRRWEFLFVCSVLPITGAVGAPVAPLAII